MKTYRIKDWSKNFENNRSRVIEKLTWVPVPNKHDGEGYLTIMDQKKGIIMYGCWHLILQVASKCTPRGTLVKDDKTPHTADSISRKTGWRQASDIQMTLDFCSSPQVGWIEVVMTETSGERQANVSTLSPNGMEGMEGMEGNNLAGSSEEHPARPLKITWDKDAQNFENITDSQIEIWKEAFPAVDVRGEISRMRAWVMANPKKLKSDWLRFFNSWLTKAQDKPSRGSFSSRPLFENKILSE